MAKNVIADTGFWFALYEPRDKHYETANKIAKLIDMIFYSENYQT
jgi:predicted nucleic acid-binding protein